MSQANTMMRVQVWRGGAQGRFESFAVPRRTNQTVLDVVTWIQRHADASLAYRFACRVGMCGSCAMTVNERPCWTCRKHVSNAIEGNRLRIAPLENLPVIRDLVADLKPFFDKWHAARGHFDGTRDRGQATSAIRHDSAKRRQADLAIECINCAVCYSACDAVGWNPSYLGPAALNRAWAAYNDERDASPADILPAVSGDAGLHGCHGMRSCSAHCPVGLNPARSIAGLKRQRLRRALKLSTDS